jgi:hypothetical protein
MVAMQASLEVNPRNDFGSLYDSIQFQQNPSPLFLDGTESRGETSLDNI